MLAKLVTAHGHRFVHLSAESEPFLDGSLAFRNIVERFERELLAFGLSLDDTVYTRLWGRTAADRQAASDERRRLLAGKRRGASSSYIAPGHFASEAVVAVDLIAMHGAAAKKTIVEYEPPIAPPLYVAVDDMVFLSGLCLVEPTLEDAVPKTLAQLGDFMKRAGVGWDNAIEIASYLNRERDTAAYERLLAPAVRDGVPTELVLVDGHAVPGAHVEIEVTAKR
jgi:enamine deaminase RidA (YjgF/YER057c/UK114 family)